jgi:hypothetical protein
MDDVFLARAKIPAPLDTDRIGLELTETTEVDVSDAVTGDEPAEADVIDAASAPVGGAFPDISADSEVEVDRREATASVPEASGVVASEASAVSEVTLENVTLPDAVLSPENVVSPDPEAGHEPQR